MRSIRTTAASSPIAWLENEFAQEKAAALGRLGRALEEALAALAGFDAARVGGATRSLAEIQKRAELVENASSALWLLVVQREACRLHDFRLLLRDYRVPPEVEKGMGAMPLAKAPAR